MYQNGSAADDFASGPPTIGGFEGPRMKQRTSQVLYGYWNDIRGDRMAPRRFDIEPSRISEILAETLVLERIDSHTFVFRLAGTKICDAFGIELRGRNFSDFMGDEGRFDFEHAMAAITDQGAAGVFELEALDANGRTARFEAILLPLTHIDDKISRYLGSVSAIEPPVWLGFERLEHVKLCAHWLIWPDGRPHAVLERNNRQSPFLPEFANARVVRLNRRQFRVLDGGRKPFGSGRSGD